MTKTAVVKLLHDVGGWRGRQLVQAVQVVLGESGGNPKARNVNKNGSIDRGLWQINNKYHPAVSDAQADDPVLATKYARKLYNSRGWAPWYGRSSYARARAAVVAAGLSPGLHPLALGAAVLAGIYLVRQQWARRQA